MQGHGEGGGDGAISSLARGGGQKLNLEKKHFENGPRRQLKRLSIEIDDDEFDEEDDEILEIDEASGIKGAFDAATDEEEEEGLDYQIDGDEIDEILDDVQGVEEEGEEAGVGGISTDRIVVLDASDRLGVSRAAQNMIGGVEHRHHAALHSHRHDLPERKEYSHSLVGGMIWLLVILHLSALLIWLRAWWKQKKSKDPTMRSMAPFNPPQKVGCSYDMETFPVPKIDLPMKALAALKKSRA